MTNGNKLTIDWTKPESWPVDWYKNLPKSTLFGGGMQTVLSNMPKATGTFASQIEKWQYENLRWSAAAGQLTGEISGADVVPSTAWWSRIPSAIVSAGKLITGAPIKPRLAPAPEESAANMEALKQRESEIATSMERSQFMTQFYNIIEAAVSAYGVTSLADYVALKDFPTDMLTSEDIAEAEAVIKKLTGGTTTEITPTTEQQIVEFLTGKTKITPNLPHKVTVDEIIKGLTGQLYPAPTLPEGVAPTDVLAIMEGLGLTEEQKQELSDFQNLVDPILEAYRAQLDDIDAIRTGAKEWEMPKLSAWEQFMFGVSQPMQALSDTFQPYLENVVYPLSGLATWSIQKLVPGTQGMEKGYNEARAAGNDIWHSFGTGWEEYDISWWQKLPIELVLDPLNFFPGWGLSIPGKVFLKAGTKMGALSGFGFRIAGHSMLSFNEGLWHLTDVPFDFIKLKLSKLGTTLRMKSEQDLAKLKAMTISAYGEYTHIFKNGSKAFDMATDEQLIEMLKLSRLAAATFPDNTDSLMVGLGKYLDAMYPLDEEAIGRLSKKLGGTLKSEEVTDNILEEVNDILVDSASKRDWTIAAKKLAMSLGIEDNADNITAIAKYLSDNLEEHANRRITQLEKLLKTDHATIKMVDTLVAQQHQIYRAYDKSAYAATKRVSGAMGALINGVDKLELAGWRVALDKWFNRPLVSAYLASPTVAIGNIVESLMVQLPEGILPKAATRVDFLNTFKGLMVDPKLLKAAVEGKMAGEPTNILGQVTGKVSVLPSKVLGEKFMGVAVPQFLQGKDALAIFGKTWLDMADYWGTAFRMGAMVRLYTKYLAERATNVAGKDVMKEFKNIIKGAPNINPALKLSSKDIENRTFMAAVSDISGNALRELKSSINNTILLRQRLQEIVRVHGTDFLPEAKAVLYDMIDSGELLREPVISRLLDWDKVNWVDLRLKEFGKPSPEISKAEMDLIQGAIDRLPVTMKSNVKNIVIDPDTSGYAQWIPETRTISLHPQLKGLEPYKGMVVRPGVEERTVDESLYHEFLHSYITTRWEEGDYSLILGFVNDAVENNESYFLTHILEVFGTKADWGDEVPILRQWLSGNKIWSIQAHNGFYNRFKYFNELLSEDFSRWVLGKKTMLPSAGKFFERTLPKRAPAQPSLLQSLEKAYKVHLAGLKQSNFSIGKRFKDFLDRVLEEPVDSPQRYAENLYNYISMVDVQHNTIQKMILGIADEADVARAAKKFGEVSAIWNKGRQQVESAVNEINDVMTQYKLHLIRTNGVLKPTQQQTVDALLSDIDERVTYFGKYLQSHQEDVAATWKAVKGLSSEEKSAVWDAYWLREAARREAYVTEDAQLYATSLLSRQKWANLINKTPKPTPPPKIDVTTGAISVEQLARALGCNTESLYSSFTQVAVMQSKPHFIKMVQTRIQQYPTKLKGFTEEKIGKVYDEILENLALDPKLEVSSQIALKQIDSIYKRITTLKLAKGMTKEQEAALHKYFDDAATKVQSMFGADKNLQVSWQKIRQEAADEASKTYYKMYADYTNQSLINRFGRMIFPYWTYHNYRWFWLARTGVRHPGYVSAWNKYYEHTDRGAIDIPGLDLAINPIAGTVVGPLVGLMRKDYSSYYDGLGWMGEALDTMQKFAFFPAPSIMSIAYISTTFKGGKLELGSLLPPTHRLGLNLLIKSEVPGVKDAASFLQEHVFHDNFRDYYKATAVDDIQAKAGGTRAEGIGGAEIWEKIKLKKPLSDEEQQLWDEADSLVSSISMLRAWFPLFRYKPKAATEFYENIDKIFLSYGFTEQQMEYMREHNTRPSDVMGGETLELKITLDELWETRLWKGRTRILLPPETQAVYMKLDEYWGAVKNLQERRLSVQADIDYRFLNPTATQQPMTPDDYRSAYRENWANYSEGVRILNEDDDRFNYPEFQSLLTPEGQVELYKKTGTKPPVRGPADELIDLYFSVQLEDKPNKYTGEIEPDYLGFIMKRKAVIDACPPDYQADFLAIIDKYDTGLMKVMEQAMDTYVSGYLSIPRIVFETYDEDSKALIEEFYSSGITSERKDDIRAEIDPNTGNKLISAYESALTEARRRMRVVSPTLDFWLYVYGYIDKPKTPTAQAMVDAWEQDRTSILK